VPYEVIATLLVRVRRTAPADPVKAPVPGRGKGPPPIRVNRVDTLLAIYRRVPVARANALLGAADGLPGRVVRHCGLLRAVAGD
jgi:hypothetical protein